MASNANRVSAKELALLREGHAAGKTLPTLCLEIGRSYRTLARHADLWGLTFPRIYRTTKNTDLQHLKRGHAEGKPAAHIAKELGMSITQVRLHASLLGLRFKPGRPTVRGSPRTREQFEAEQRVIAQVAPVYGIRPTAKAMGLEPTRVLRVLRREGLKSPFARFQRVQTDAATVAAAVGRAWLETMGGQAA